MRALVSPLAPCKKPGSSISLASFKHTKQMSDLKLPISTVLMSYLQTSAYDTPGDITQRGWIPHSYGLPSYLAFDCLHLLPLPAVH